MCLCCTTLRGVAYFAVNAHMLGSFALFCVSAYAFLFARPFDIPPGLEDVNPLFIQNFPLLLGGYALAASLCSCFIYRAIDMESLFQLTWSVVSFAGFQFLVMFLHLIFTVMFRDLVATQWQIIMAAALVGNFCATVVYLTVLFLFGKKIHYYKYTQNIRNSIGNNVPNIVASVLKKQTNSVASSGETGSSVVTRSTSPTNPSDLNLLANHPPVSRTNSVCKSTSTDDDDLDEMEGQRRGSAAPAPSATTTPCCPHHQPLAQSDSSPPPSYHSTPGEEEETMRPKLETVTVK